MPELAEVEYARKIAERFLVGKKVVHVSGAQDCDTNVFANNCISNSKDADGENLVAGVSAVILALNGAQIIGVRRKGKHLFLFARNAAARSLFRIISCENSDNGTTQRNVEFDGESGLEHLHVLHVHFGMSGQFFSRSLSEEHYGRYGVAQERSPPDSDNDQNDDRVSSPSFRKKDEVLNRSVIFQEHKEKLSIDMKWPPRFSKLLLKLERTAECTEPMTKETGVELHDDEFSYDDSRKFGFIRILTNGNGNEQSTDFDSESLFEDYECYVREHATRNSAIDFLMSNISIAKRLKPDPLLSLPSSDDFLVALQSHEFRKHKKQSSEPNPIPIKTLLLDQECIVCGLGNWLVDDILFHAKIHPAEIVAELLKQNKAEVLRLSIGAIVTKACEANANAELFPKHWLFHVRWTLNRGNKSVAEKCANVSHFDKDCSERSDLDIIVVGQRTTILDKRSQKLSETALKLADVRSSKRVARLATPKARRTAGLVDARAGRSAGRKPETASRRRVFARLRISRSVEHAKTRQFQTLRSRPTLRFKRLREASTQEAQARREKFTRLVPARSDIVEL